MWHARLRRTCTFIFLQRRNFIYIQHVSLQRKTSKSYRRKCLPVKFFGISGRREISFTTHISKRIFVTLLRRLKATYSPSSAFREYQPRSKHIRDFPVRAELRSERNVIFFETMKTLERTHFSLHRNDISFYRLNRMKRNLECTLVAVGLLNNEFMAKFHQCKSLS